MQTHANDIMSCGTVRNGIVTHNIIPCDMTDSRRSIRSIRNAAVQSRLSETLKLARRHTHSVLGVDRATPSWPITLSCYFTDYWFQFHMRVVKSHVFAMIHISKNLVPFKVEHR